MTIKVVSDKYIAPGTPVSGKVGGKAFMGTVTGAPNKQRRMGQIERRLSQLEPGSRGKLGRMREKLARMDAQLWKLEGHKTVEERIQEMEKRIVDLERRPPSKHSLAFAGNVAGFHFLGSLGHTDAFRTRIDRLDARLAALEDRKTPAENALPMEKALDGLEAKLDEATSEKGRIHQGHEISELEDRLKKIELKYGSGGGENSKHYGTEEYHGLYHRPVPVSEHNAPAGVYP